jgi:hypothetical protein
VEPNRNNNQEQPMKKISILTLTMIALASFVAVNARAQSPHYIKGPTGSLNNPQYCVSFKEAGLGSTPVTYTITTGAGTCFTYQCFTKSNNTPQGDPNSVSGSGQTTDFTITPHNGQINTTVCIGPAPLPQGNVGCQGKGLELRLIGVSYQNVTISDTGTGQTFNLASASFGTNTGCQ